VHENGVVTVSANVAGIVNLILLST